MNKALSANEAAVLQAHVPDGMTPDTAEVAWCLFEVIASADARSGTREPDGAWLAELDKMAALAMAQTLHLLRELGGRAIYLPKGVALRLNARDREMIGKFRGNNYLALAREYDLTEMRVRQIINAWRAERFAQRQGRLPGLGGSDGTGNQ